MLGGNPAYDPCALVVAGNDRLGIAQNMWLIETNTAVASACAGPGQCATTFASPAMLAAGFNRTAWQVKGAVISTEMRALHNAGVLLLLLSLLLLLLLLLVVVAVCCANVLVLAVHCRT